MMEQRFDGTEILTKNPSSEEIFGAMANELNETVKLIPNIDEPKEYFIIQKRGKWKKVKNKNYER